MSVDSPIGRSDLRNRARCLIADEEPMLREALGFALSARADVEIVASTDNADRADELFRATHPDIAVIDLALPGRSSLELLRVHSANTRIAVYTGRRHASALGDALDAGARAFILKTSPGAEIVAAIQALLSGNSYVDPRIAAELVRRPTEQAARLGPRELQVLELLANGATTAAIGEALFLSPATVRSYAELAIRKLDAHNRTQAVAQALRRGLIA